MRPECYPRVVWIQNDLGGISTCYLVSISSYVNCK